MVQWKKCLGGSSRDFAYAIQQTTDGGYIIAGDSWSTDGDVTNNHGYDCWVVKLDGSGNIQWQKCLGGTNVDVATDIQQTSDGGYIVAGQAGSTDGDVTGNHGAPCTAAECPIVLHLVKEIADVPLPNFSSDPDREHVGNRIPVADSLRI